MLQPAIIYFTLFFFKKSEKTNCSDDGKAKNRTGQHDHQRISPAANLTKYLPFCVQVNDSVSLCSVEKLTKIHKVNRVFFMYKNRKTYFPKFTSVTHSSSQKETNDNAIKLYGKRKRIK